MTNTFFKDYTEASRRFTQGATLIDAAIKDLKAERQRLVSQYKEAAKKLILQYKDSVILEAKRAGVYPEGKIKQERMTLCTSGIKASWLISTPTPEKPGMCKLIKFKVSSEDLELNLILDTDRSVD